MSFLLLVSLMSTIMAIATTIMLLILAAVCVLIHYPYNYRTCFRGRVKGRKEHPFCLRADK